MHIVQWSVMIVLATAVSLMVVASAAAKGCRRIVGNVVTYSNNCVRVSPEAAAAAPAAKRRIVVLSRGYAAQLPPTESLEAIVRQAAERYNVSPDLIRAVIEVESNGNPQAVSRAGARGLMQLMPGTANQLGVWNSFDPQENVDGGVRHLRGLLDRFGGNLALSLASYNAGEGAVRAYGGIPPYPETQAYVARITSLLRGQSKSLTWETKIPRRLARVTPAHSGCRRQMPDGTVAYANFSCEEFEARQRRRE